MFRNELIECLEMPGFLIVHVLHKGSEVRVLANKDRILGGIDQDSGQFAGLVDAKLRSN
jgi:hypothetical protein